MRNIIFLANLSIESLGWGKGGRAFIKTINAFIEEGWNVYLIITNKDTPKELRTKIHLYEADLNGYNPVGGRTRIARVVKRYIYIIKLNRFFYSTARKIIKKESSRYFVIYAYEVWAVNAAKVISKLYRIPLVTRFQGTVHTSTDDTIKNRIKYAPHLGALKCPADLVIMTNDGTKGLDTIKRLGNKSSNVKFWMNGVSIPSLPKAEDISILKSKFGFHEKFIFLTVSRLVNWKRVDRAIVAFADACKQISTAQLHIIGDGDARHRLEELTRQLNVSDRVIFHGSVLHNEVVDYMNASDVFLSLYDLSNVGNPLLEAMSVGKPIITMNNGDTGSFIKNGVNGILIDPDKMANVSLAMKQLYEDSTLRNRLACGAREFAIDHFWSWEERMSAEIDEVSKLIEIDD